MSMAGHFNGTCEVVDLGMCGAGTLFLNPCDCASYYECGQDYTMVVRTCAPGTLYVPGLPCDRELNVRIESCKGDSWDRCNVSDSRLLDLEKLCTSSTAGTSSTPHSTRITPTTESPSGGLNGGMVVGLIIAGMVLALIVIAVIVVFRRRQRAALTRKATSKSIAHNPEYFEGGVENDPYAIINDSFMSDPTYRGISGSRTLDSISTTSTTLQSNVEPPKSIYDNSFNVTRQLPDSPNTPTMAHNAENHQYDTLAPGSRPVNGDPQTLESRTTTLS